MKEVNQAIKEIQEYFKDLKIITKHSINKSFGTFNNSIQEEIRKIYFWTRSDRELIFCIINNINEEPICELADCTKTKEFQKNKYSSGCCPNHKKKITNLERFGAEHNWSKGTTSREKFKKTMEEKYGGFTLQSKTLKEKVRETNLKRYGVGNPFQSDEIKNKIKETNLKKYGVENPAHHPKFIKKRIETFKKSSQSHQEKIQQTLLERYNCVNPNHIGKEKYIKFLNLEKDEQIKQIIEKGIYTLSMELEVSTFPLRTILNQFQVRPGLKRIEYELFQTIKNLIPNQEIIQNDRKILNGKELDIIIPEKKIAIEFNGLYWHSELNGKDRNYHLNKTILAEEKGYQLIHIFEDEWMEKRDIVISIIKSKLGIFDKRIYARKTTIREIDYQSASKFLEENHIQGKDQSSIKIGLYHNDELVSVMTFGKPRFNKNYQYEMHRFCSKKGYQIVGGASKLFKYFIRNYNPQSVITYADRRYSKGETYPKLGFELKSVSKPNFFVLPNKGKLKRMSRLKFQKHKQKEVLENFNPNLTAWENMQLNGYNRIWDCGNYVFSWKNVK